MNSALTVNDHHHAFKVWPPFLTLVMEKTVSFVSISGALFLGMKQNLIHMHFYVLS